MQSVDLLLRVLLVVVTPTSEADAGRLPHAHVTTLRVVEVIYDEQLDDDAATLLSHALDQPDVKPLDVTMAWAAAELEATPRVDAALAMALMWPESRYQPTAQPACGVMQVYPHDIYLPDASSCALCRHDVRAGVRAGVTEIEMLLADHRVHSLRQALLYRACGNRAFTGECAMGRWVDQALERRKVLLGLQPAA
jgi:hypothetical protein